MPYLFCQSMVIRYVRGEELKHSQGGGVISQGVCFLSDERRGAMYAQQCTMSLLHDSPHKAVWQDTP